MANTTPKQKLAFYDNCFKLIGLSLLITLCLYVFFFSIEKFIGGESGLMIYASISLFVAVVFMDIVFFGMIYHMFVEKYYGLLFITIISSFIGIGLIISFVFYWYVMRKKFKKGKAVMRESSSLSVWNSFNQVRKGI